MDWDQPIGLGKMGNNPYALGAAGVGLATGGQGLIPMLGSALMGGSSNDPRIMQQFMAAAEAQNAPVTEIPRQGLLPQLLAKAGILSPNMKASPYMMNLETIDLRQKQAEKASQMLQAWTGLMDIAQKGGPAAAGQAFGSIPGMSAMFPTFDPTQIKTPEMLHEKAESDRFKIDQARLRSMDERTAILQQNANTNAARAATAEERAAALEEGKQKNEDMRLYSSAYSQLGDYARGMTDPKLQEESRRAQNFLYDAAGSGIPFEAARLQAQRLFPDAMMSQPDAPKQADDSGYSLPSLSGILHAVGYGGPTPAGAAATGATPYGSARTIVPPRFTK